MDVVQCLGFDDRKTSVDPSLVQGRLFLEVTDAIAVELQRPEPRGRTDRGERDQGATRTMKRHQLVEAHVPHAVAIRQHERAAANQGLELPQTAPGQRRLPGVHEVHLPWLQAVANRRNVAVLERDRHVASDRMVVKKVPLDLIALVSERKHEFIEAIPGVVLHDVPEDWTATDLDERLRTQLRLL